MHLKSANITILAVAQHFYKTACVPREDRSACALEQSDQSSQGTVGSQGSKASSGQGRLWSASPDVSDMSFHWVTAPVKTFPMKSSDLSWS